MLKLIAPFRVLFNLDSSLIVAQPSGFTEFLKQIREALSKPDSALVSRLNPALDITVNLPTVAASSGVESRYSSLDSTGSFYVSPRVFSLRFKDSEISRIMTLMQEAAIAADKTVAPYSQLFTPDVHSLCIDFYDNTIAILTLDLPMNMKHFQPGMHAWDNLDQWTTRFLHYLLTDLYPRYIYPMLRVLTQFSGEVGAQYVKEPRHYKVFVDMIGEADNLRPDLDRHFMLMWVNRTLLYSGDYPANDWIRATTREAEIIRIGDAALHLNWGNNQVRLEDGMNLKRLSPLWEGMLSAQYYYAVMDAVSTNLIKYVGMTFVRLNSKSLRRLSSDMEILVSAVNILQVRYKDISMEVQGLARDIFHHLEREWNFSTLTDNVQMKIDLCKVKITSLNSETVNRNAARTEFVLTALAGISVVNLAVDLASFATQLTPEYANMVGKFGLMSFARSISSDTLGWAGISGAILVLLFAFMNRRV
jgi:hypothetical protein